MNWARPTPGSAAAVMTTVPTTVPPAGSASATVVNSGIGSDVARLATDGAPRWDAPSA